MEINTLSQKIVYDMLNDKKLEDYNDLGFCLTVIFLTVIRDNCLCGYTYEYLDLLIKNLGGMP